MKLPKHLFGPLESRYKIMASMDLNDRNPDQTGIFGHTVIGNIQVHITPGLIVLTLPNDEVA
jgi:hypothetical protein